ncbi:MAG: PKD domain-containing protein [Planctomycetota bacterium]
MKSYKMWFVVLLIFFSPIPLYADPAVGPLEVHPANTRYFDNGSGQAVYLTGSHNWANLQDELGQPIVNYTDYLDWLQSYGHNFTRGWHWEDAYYTPLPYARTGPGNANDGGLKFDLTQYNQAYFDRVKARAEEAGNRGIYISIMLFQGWSVDDADGARNPNPWVVHPYNDSNNINGIDGDTNNDNKGQEIHTMAIPAVTAMQDNYVRHTIDQLNYLDNIIWEISNESRDGSQNWQEHMINLIHSYELTKPKQHLVWLSPRGDWTNNAYLFTSPADVVSPEAFGNGKEYKTDPPASSGTKIVILDTDHLWGVGGDAVWVWKSFTRGHHPIYMDPIYGLGWISKTWDPNAAQYVAARQAMGYTLSYAQRMNLSGVIPQPSSSSTPASTKYCLYENGAKYLVYQPASGQALTLNMLAGTYGYEWFNANTGTVEEVKTIIWPGGNREFTPPFSNNAVLFVTDEPVAPIAVINANPTSGISPLTVNLDGTGSYDTDGGSIVSYEWDFTNDGTIDTTDSTTAYTYHTSRLRIYTVTLTVIDNHGYSGTASVDITVNVNQICDFDNDTDVDQEDFGHFQACMSGTGNIQTNPDCFDALLDDDNDVDLIDFNIFQGCMSGANVPANPNCAD